MKIIFSRKGFDSENGGIPSPIFPDKTMVSYPILSDQVPSFREIGFKNTNLGDILEQISYGIDPDGGTHLDPDLRYDAIPRLSGWKPCFGQVGGPQTHLENMGVGIGDIFLFFGWFSETYYDENEGKILFDPKAPNLHVIFGWLQVGNILKPDLNPGSIPGWAKDHPHARDVYNDYKNTIYVASELLQVPGLKRKIPGGGAFEKFNKSLQLTAPGCSRSVWKLPRCMYPEQDKTPLSYHVDMKRWQKQDDHVILKSVAKGQEFVLDCSEYPGSYDWVLSLFEN
jgi:hypothetical protein